MTKIRLFFYFTAMSVGRSIEQWGLNGAMRVRFKIEGKS